MWQTDGNAARNPQDCGPAASSLRDDAAEGVQGKPGRAAAWCPWQADIAAQRRQALPQAVRMSMLAAYCDFGVILEQNGVLGDNTDRDLYCARQRIASACVFARFGRGFGLESGLIRHAFRDIRVMRPCMEPSCVFTGRGAPGSRRGVMRFPWTLYCG